ncbi:NAD(+) diphosphatase [Saccharibacillus alkalitolerans]|uniref:NAD(+) diphosphatase n=1 Tax=Saccharibacillus alkalitolerans TaxID=2705290 RepID=A0ABX0FCV9_9BACL|nr:NAD(+) diphosphatase [Saccharibacillus alkalitolerans]NGZ77231.1 NAD(+) diphosphatase [Saccharibacillus alkalitolerans]
MPQSRPSIYDRYIPALSAEPSDLPAYRFVFLAGTANLLLNEGSGLEAIPSAADAAELGFEPSRSLYLGTLGGAPCYAAEAPEGAVPPDGTAFLPLRSLYEVLDEDLFHLAGRALQMLNWDATHRFCGRCGTTLTLADRDRAKVCPNCGLSQYPRLSPAVITAILKDGKILLAHAAHFQNDMYGLIAGFAEPGETLEDCVRRETMEEVGIELGEIRYFGSQQWPFPNSLMIGFVAEYAGGEIAVDGEEIAHAAWFGPDELPNIPPKVSIARKIIDWYAEEYGSPTDTPKTVDPDTFI